MKSALAAAVHSHLSLRGLRRAVARLLTVSPAALLLSGLLLVTGTPVALAASGDWPQFQGGPAHLGYDAQEGILSPSNVANLGVAWTGASGVPVFSPVVADGVVYVASGGGTLYAFAVGCASGGGTCTPLWTAAAGRAISSSPAVANGVVYVASREYDDNGTLYAFAVGCASGGGTCTPLWTGSAVWAMDTSPTVADGVVYVGDSAGKLYAFDANGSTLWTATTGHAAIRSPAVVGGRVYLATDGGLYTFAVGCASGGGTCGYLWHGSYGELSSPAVANGVVYVGSGVDGQVVAFDTACVPDGYSECASLWTGSTGLGVSSPAVANGVVYVGSGVAGGDKNGVHAYTVGCGTGGATCSPLWSGTTGDPSYSTPIVANGLVFVSSSNWLHAFAVGCATGGGTCASLWSGRAGGATTIDSPVVANGVVYVGSNAGLYAFALHKTLTFSGIPNPDAAGGAHTVTVTAKDGASGNTATGYTGTIHFTSSDPRAVLPADYTFKAADAGVHTFSISLKTAGTQSVTATDTAFALIKGGQVGILVNATALTKFVVSGITTPRTAGAAGSIRVTATDASGNRIHGYLGTVHFTSSDAQAKLPANYAFTATDAGTHVFSGTVIFKTAGMQSITATDTVTASIKGSQTGIVLTVAALSKLVVSGITTPRTAGTTGSIRVTATDAYGNRIHGYLGTIHFTSSDAKAGLPANYAFTAADAGTHVFVANVILKTAATQSVTATDTVSATIKGSQTGIVVQPAGVKVLVVSGLTTPRTAGTTGSIRVTAVDTYGNRVPNYRGTIHFSCTDSSASLPADYTFTAADNGTHVFVANVILRTSGSQWVRATDTATSTITGLQSAVVFS
jgi:outer membrane protein assembly factor BamB